MSDSHQAAEQRQAAWQLEAARRLVLTAGCYYHPHTLASGLCGVCGRALCLESLVRVEGEARCPECAENPEEPVLICGRCGWIAREAAPECPHCGAPECPVPRQLHGETAFWQRRFRGHSRDDRLWVFGITWLGTYGLGLLGGMPLALMGVPQSPAWWLFMAVVSGACGAVAAQISERAARFELLLSQDGIDFRTRRRPWERLRWDEVLGLEFSPAGHPRHLLVRGPGRQITIDRNVAGWTEAVRLIRQHAAVAAPPDLAW